MSIAGFGGSRWASFWRAVPGALVSEGSAQEVVFRARPGYAAGR